MTSDATTLEQVLSDVHLYTDHEDDLTAVMANVAAVLKVHRPQYTWVGFYIMGCSPDEMVLGPYQGPPTCTTRIPIHAGMCGLAARERRTIILPDVRTDPRYIACSSTVRSEIVAPLLNGERVLGVLDVDSDDIDAFAAEDQALLEGVASYVAKKFRRSGAEGSLVQGERERLAHG
jgi:L-methionine (R)-S-oxide reductase